MTTTADLSPHPLIPQVASGLIELGVPLVTSARSLFQAKLMSAAPLAMGPPLTAEEQEKRLDKELEDVTAKLRTRPPLPKRPAGRQGQPNPGQSTSDDDAALALAGATGVPELVTFAGYVGGRFPDKDTVWCVFYLDKRLTNSLIIDTNGIVFRDRLLDDYAPCGQRDVIWVKADAPVGLGKASEAAQAQFLTGEFTSAGDIDAPPGAGTLDAATGVFCEATTVGCCKNNTTSKYCKG